MSKAVVVAIGGILGTFLVQGEYRNLAFTGASALASWQLFDVVRKQEQEETARLFSPAVASPTPVLPPVQAVAAAQAQSTTTVVVEGATIHNHPPAAVPGWDIAYPGATPCPASERTTPAPAVEPTVISYGNTRESLDFALPEDDSEVVQDIPLLLADSIASGTNPGHLLVSCKTGSGKTTFIKSLIRRMYELEGDGFIVVDPKGSQWMGLRRVFRIRQDSDAHNILAVARKTLEILQSRIAAREKAGASEGIRITLILDEWPTLLDMSKAVKIDEQLMSVLNAIVRLGREDRVNLWIMGQSHLVSEAGFSRTTQNNFELVALGRDDQLQSVRSIISDQWVIQDRKRRQSLNSQLDQLDPTQTPVAFTSAGGGRLCKLPDLSEFVKWEIPAKE